MKRMLILALLTLPLLGGCVIYDDGGGWGHRHYWHDRW
jgi:hypothetical protein